MNFVVDVDDVIARLRDQIMMSLNHLTHRNIHWTDWNDFHGLPQLYGITEAQLFKAFIAYKVIENCAPEAGAVEALNQIRQLGGHITVVTARGWHPYCEAITTSWLARNSFAFDDLIIAKTTDVKMDLIKHLGDVDYMIDDGLHNISAAEQSGRVRRPVLISRPWNAHSTAHAPGVNRFGSISEFVDSIASAQRPRNDGAARAPSP